MDNLKLQEEQFGVLLNECRPTLFALGNETRQIIVRMLVEHIDDGGLRAVQIIEGTAFSRTAISHHLQILKRAGIIKMRTEGKKNFYYIDIENDSLKLMARFVEETGALLKMHRDKEEAF